MKTRQPTAAEVANDRSLKFHPTYLNGEVLRSDAHGLVRFNGYAADGTVSLSTLNSMDSIPVPVDPLTVRRATVQ